MKIKEDVVSNFKGLVYAKAGTEVIVISNIMDIAIVENDKTKERFSCKISNLTEEELQILETISEEQIKIISKPVKAAKITKQPEQQTTLF
jgi:hypothetical protein